MRSLFNTHWSVRNGIALVLIVAALAVLYPGLTLPMLNLTIGATLPFLGEVEFYNETQSIAQSIRVLTNGGHYLVAILIFLFSVFVPLIKALLLLSVIVLSAEVYRQRVHRFILLIGKWSMADVFVVGIFMACLAGQAHPNTQASLHAGFYYFTAYCVLSILGAQLVTLDHHPEQ